MQMAQYCCYFWVQGINIGSDMIPLQPDTDGYSMFWSYKYGDPNLVIIVPADVPAPDGAGTSVGTVMMAELDIFAS